MDTLYDTLEVSRSASHETLNAAHRALSRKYHPDNAASADTERYHAVQEAWEVLGDARKRRQYDASLKRRAVPPPAPPINPEPLVNMIVDRGMDQVERTLGHLPGVHSFLRENRAGVRAAVKSMLRGEAAGGRS